MRIEAGFKGFLQRAATLTVVVMTFPYYRNFHFNTLRPIQLMAACTGSPAQRNKLLFLLDRWKQRKREELQFVSIAVSEFLF